MLATNLGTVIGNGSTNVHEFVSNHLIKIWMHRKNGNDGIHFWLDWNESMDFGDNVSFSRILAPPRLNAVARIHIFMKILE